MKDIQGRIIAEYATCEDPLALAKELGITAARMRYFAGKHGIKRVRLARSFEMSEKLRMERESDDARRIVQTAIANRNALESAWHQVVAA
jgi:hypothetical protein